jgi:N-acylneuraminate cytidylyltransferase
MRLAVIPARGGSKRVPRKNIKAFHGRPMIAWPIAAALESACFDRIVVSTDDPEIAEVARAAGAEVPFLRPAELSGDHVPTIPVVAHAIRWLEAQGLQPSAACCIYATSAFVQPDDLRRGAGLLESTGCDYAFSAVLYPAPIQRAFRVLPDGGVEMFQPALFNTRSQDLEPAYHDAAQFYWGRPGAWKQDIPIFSRGARAIVLPRTRVQDIDTPEDWEAAERMFAALHRPARP